MERAWKGQRKWIVVVNKISLLRMFQKSATFVCFISIMRNMAFLHNIQSCFGRCFRCLGLYILLLTIFLPFGLQARTIRIYGYVLDSDNRGVEFANAYIDGTSVGTTTNRNGYYDLHFDLQDTITLVYSMLGYETIRQAVYPGRDIMQINVILPTNTEALEEIEVRGLRRQTDMMDQTDIQALRVMPDATGGGIESILITFAGVNQNNELSSQYNVRGGNFDENSVYVNGIEIYRPLLLRAGQQEGLSFANPDMVDNLQFSAGGFDAQYGDKMSSVLDITYKKPDRTQSILNVSLLGASAYVGTGNQNYSMMHGLRYKTNRYMLGAMPTKGSYQPNFVDYQTYITWKLDPKRKEQSRWEMSFLGNFSQNSYAFRPDSLSQAFGTYAQARNLRCFYTGQEKDMFRTAFAALGLTYKANRDLHFDFTLSGFYTNEQENYDITCEYLLTDKPMNGEDTSASDEEESVDVLGTGIYHEHARNQLQAGVATFAHRGEWRRDANRLSWGVSAQAEMITDRISEWEWRDSVGYSVPSGAEDLELYYAMRGQTSMRTARIQAYAQDTYKWNTPHGNVLLTGGLRMQWWSWNNEVLVSPRASVSWFPGWKRDFAFRFATGLYYQAPFYKELRDTLTDATGVTRIELNKNIRAQRSVHVVLGGDYYFRAWGRPFKLTAEAYYKYMDRVISYTVDNVRVRYSGENDAIAYTTGLDLKLFGELVPGADSWISLSFMRARENLLYDNRGWINAPQNQAVSFSMLFQDYIPKFPQYKFHLRMIFNTGLPYGSPRNLETRASHTMPGYKRIDIGASRTFSAKTDKWMRSKHVESWWVQFEVLNLINWNNVNSYFWVSTYMGEQYNSPNYLTGRMYNLKIGVELK